MSTLTYSLNEQAPPTGGAYCLICHFGFQLLGLVDHLLYLGDSGNTAADVELCIDFLEFRLGCRFSATR